MSILKLFPWDDGVEPYFVNDEGFEWYVDKNTTDWATKDTASGVKGLKDVICFFVKKADDITRVLINSKQEILAEDKNWEQLLSKIDMLKISKHVK